MAEFVKYPGSPGIWTASEKPDGQDRLTIALGERADLFLVGGGPPGKERLDIAYDGVLTAKAIAEFPWDKPNQRLISITPAMAGDGRIAARLPNNGPTYTRTIQIVVLPRKPSSLAPESVSMFSKTLKDEGDELGGVYRKAMQNSQEGLVIVAESYAEFVKFLTTFRDTGRRIGALSIYSHGSPGLVKLGKDTLDIAGVSALQGKGYDKVFATGARVFFSGCNVAEGLAGVGFLKQFGKTFLFNGGGSVGGSTSWGISIDQGLGNGKMYHLWGDTVRLFFDTTGKIIEATGIDDPAELAIVNR